MLQQESAGLRAELLSTPTVHGQQCGLLTGRLCKAIPRCTKRNNCHVCQVCPDFTVGSDHKNGSRIAPGKYIEALAKMHPGKFLEGIEAPAKMHPGNFLMVEILTWHSFLIVLAGPCKP